MGEKFVDESVGIVFRTVVDILLMVELVEFDIFLKCVVDADDLLDVDIFKLF